MPEMDPDYETTQTTIGPVDTIFIPPPDFDMSLWSENITNIWPNYGKNYHNDLFFNTPSKSLKLVL